MKNCHLAVCELRFHFWLFCRLLFLSELCWLAECVVFGPSNGPCATINKVSASEERGFVYTQLTKDERAPDNNDNKLINSDTVEHNNKNNIYSSTVRPKTLYAELLKFMKEPASEAKCQCNVLPLFRRWARTPFETAQITRTIARTAPRMKADSIFKRTSTS